MNSSGELVKSIGEIGDIRELCWKFLGLTERINRLEWIVLLLFLVLLM